jgi:hypothetical protein
MATYSATNYLTTPVVTHGLSNNLKAFYFEVACAAAPSTSDTINFGYVPKNFRLLHATIEATDMDTGGSPTLALNVGDSGDADRLFAASTVGQAGTQSSAITTNGFGYKYTDKTLITGVASANAATGAAGTLYLAVFGIQEDATTS